MINFLYSSTFFPVLSAFLLMSAHILCVDLFSCSLRIHMLYPSVDNLNNKVAVHHILSKISSIYCRVLKKKSLLLLCTFFFRQYVQAWVVLDRFLGFACDRSIFYKQNWMFKNCSLCIIIHSYERKRQEKSKTIFLFNQTKKRAKSFIRSHHRLIICPLCFFFFFFLLDPTSNWASQALIKRICTLSICIVK